MLLLSLIEKAEERFGAVTFFCDNDLPRVEREELREGEGSIDGSAW